MEDRSENVMWFVAGIALGATIALLYAPASGRALRRKLGRQADKSREALSERSKEMYDRGKELFDRGRKMADDAAELLDRGKKLVEGEG